MANIFYSYFCAFVIDLAGTKQDNTGGMPKLIWEINFINKFKFDHLKPIFNYVANKGNQGVFSFFILPCEKHNKVKWNGSWICVLEDKHTC